MPIGSRPCSTTASPPNRDTMSFACCRHTHRSCADSFCHAGPEHTPSSISRSGSGSGSLRISSNALPSARDVLSWYRVYSSSSTVRFVQLVPSRSSCGDSNAARAARYRAASSNSIDSAKKSAIGVLSGVPLFRSCGWASQGVLFESQGTLQCFPKERDPVGVNTKELEHRVDGRVRNAGSEPLEVGSNDGDILTESSLHDDARLQNMQKVLNHLDVRLPAVVCGCFPLVVSTPLLVHGVLRKNIRRRASSLSIGGTVVFGTPGATRKSEKADRISTPQLRPM
ncbi:hypothetical protein HYQ46_010900 [Verticillium longisporum]|nr:hypothetical protein HYQ46_010900 [Verticillium longisporum]